MSALERTSRGAPCIFCGDVGYDMRVHYQEGTVDEVVHYCHKTKATKGDTNDISIAIIAAAIIVKIEAFFVIATQPTDSP